MNIVEASLVWIILIPLFGSIVNGLFRLKSPFNGLIATAACFASFVLSLLAFLKLSPGTLLVDPGYLWFQAGHVQVNMSFELSSFMGTMLLVITGVGTLIHLYATSYMSHDKSPWRFFSYLNLFVTAMLVLALSRDLVGVFLGWEGVGVCSYLLIGYWFEEDANTKAGMKAFITNRIGDLGFLFALFLALAFFGTSQVSEILTWIADPSKLAEIPTWVMPAFALGIFWAATGKSAQLPLYVWLPDAMAGPTPVSALIHAATMVTSGILVFVRLWPLFSTQAQVLDLVFWVAIATALLAALIAITQRDLKKVLAYSTVSQLGFMFAALGAGAPVAAFFHVVTHACFKALLFLTAGSVIHGMHDHKDIFEMGGLRKKMPWSHIAYLVGCVAIAGFPFTAGFFSKDIILAKVFESKGLLGYSMLLIAALLTSFYMFRSYALTFLGNPRTEHAEHAHESAPMILVPLMVLSALSLLVGFLEVPHIWWHVQNFSTWVEGSWSFELVEGHLSVATEWMLMSIATVGSLAAAFFAIKKYSAGPVATNENTAWKLSFNKFYVDEVYSRFIVQPFRRLGVALSTCVDEKGINGGLHGSFGLYRISGQLLSVFQTGSVQSYALFMVFGLLLIWGLLQLC
ncbi:MAG: NADH-quinone oxidoreductase subunit L [Bdellovibrionota bacterium]